METRLDRLVHWGGLIAAAGGLIWLAGLLLTRGGSFSAVRTYTPLMIAGLLVMGVGMLAGHLRIVRRTGMMGQFALGLALMSLTFMLIAWIAVENWSVDVVYFAMGFMFVLVSFLIFGIIGLWAGGLSRPAMALMLLGLLALPFMNIRTGLIWPGMVFGLAWLWLGIDLLLARIGRKTLVHA